MAYESLAEVYDWFTDDFDYDAWASWYWKLISSVKPEIRSLADCGCGTGSLAVRFAKKGIKVTGIDLSEDMLRVASDKARKWGTMARFVRQDMARLSLPSRVDAVIAACDGVNYLTSEQSVRSFFEGAYRALKSGGAFAFDISNRDKLAKMGKNYLYSEDRDDACYLWTNEYSAESKEIEMNLTFFVKEEDGRYRRFDETHVQRAHSVAEIEALLARAGFADTRVFGSDSGESEGPGGERVYFLSRKP